MKQIGEGTEAAAWIGFFFGLGGGVLGIVLFFVSLSFNDRIGLQRDFLCAHFEDADATLRDCPKDGTAERIKGLEEQLAKLKGER